MRQAINLALENIRRGTGGPFGAVVVKDGQVVGTGFNTVTNSNDPTAHAEVNAIRDACRNLNNFQLDACTIYSSCEPCPMCLGAIYWARIDKLYFAATREDAAKANFDDSLIYKEIELSIQERKIPNINILRDEALPIFREWETLEDKIRY